jgi:hypothetical protein
LGLILENHLGRRSKLLIEKTTLDTPMIPVLEDTRHIANPVNAMMARKYTD